MALNEATCMLDPNLSVKIALGVYLFGNTILSLGTERHLPIFQAVWNKQVIIFMEFSVELYYKKICTELKAFLLLVAGMLRSY